MVGQSQPAQAEDCHGQSGGFAELRLRGHSSALTPRLCDRAEISHCDQRTGALHKVSDAPRALGVAIGNSRRRRCAQCVRAERQRLQRLQQHYKTPSLGPSLGPAFGLGGCLGGATKAFSLGPRLHQGLVVPWLMESHQG
eukprot:scaffold68878_cov73-Phaeocystis_antarctica.AAC.2